MTPAVDQGVRVTLTPHKEPGPCDACGESSETVAVSIARRGRVFLCSRCILASLDVATEMRWLAQYDYAMNARKVGESIRASKPPRVRRAALKGGK